MKRFIFLTIITLSMCISPALFAGQEIVLKECTSSYKIGGMTDILEDPSGKLTLTDILSKKYSGAFQQSQEDVPNFGYTRSAYWRRFTLRNSDPAVHWFLDIPYTLLDDISLYTPVPGKKYSEQKSGRYYSFSKKEIKN